MKRLKKEQQDKGEKPRTRRDAAVKPVRGADGARRGDGPAAGKDYKKELTKLHVELVKLQRWVQATGAKIVIVFEGRDGAGKGGTIKALTERVSAPTPREYQRHLRPDARRGHSGSHRDRF